MILLLALAAVFIVVVYIAIWRARQRKNGIYGLPGPVGFPLLGAGELCAKCAVRSFFLTACPTALDIDIVNLNQWVMDQSKLFNFRAWAFAAAGEQVSARGWRFVRGSMSRGAHTPHQTIALLDARDVETVTSLEFENFEKGYKVRLRLTELQGCPQTHTRALSVCGSVQ